MTNESIDSLTQMLEQGRALHQRGESAAAEGVYLKILQRNPDHFDALNLLGVLSGQSNDPARAVHYFDRAIDVAPGNAAPYCNRGMAFKEMGRLDAALESFTQALAIDDHNHVSYYCRANVYKDLGLPENALADYDKAIALKADFALAYFHRGTVLQQARQFDAARASYDSAIALKGDYAEAYANRGYVLHRLNQIEAAVASYERAIAIMPDPAAYVYLGNALKDLNRRDAARNCYDLAIDLRADYAEAYANRGVVCYELGNIDEAIANYDRAIAIKPDYAEAYFNRASVLRVTQRFEAAVVDFKTAATLQPDIHFLPGALLEAKLQICDWSDFEAEVERVKAGIERNEAVAHPFALLTFLDDARIQRQAAEIFVREACAEDDSLGVIPKRTRSAKIRIAYFSADFREHPVSHLISELIGLHDRTRFDVVAFSFGPDTQDPMRNRIEKSFDEFLDVGRETDREIALIARKMNVDIAIDLGGYTMNSRTRIFAQRAAPIQVSYLGFPGTMGSRYMDYLIADDVVVPESQLPNVSEKVVFMPHCYLPHDSTRAISDRAYRRDELGLPQDGFVFCCFNSSYKITRSVFDGWMRILQRTPSSVLWLSAATAEATANLRRAAAAHGIDLHRLIFARRFASSADHLSRLRAADLFLDTLPYNAHATAIEALWAGLPILTRRGDGFAARVGASLLRAIDLPDLITSNAEQYENLAVALSLDQERLADIKQRLAINRLTKPLFDGHLFVRHLESAYSSIHERCVAGLPPDHIRVRAGNTAELATGGPRANRTSTRESTCLEEPDARIFPSNRGRLE